MRQADLANNGSKLAFLVLNIHLPDIIRLAGMVDRHQEVDIGSNGRRICTSVILHLTGP